MLTENKSTRVYVPRVGTNVKLRTWSDYIDRDIHVWSWFRVCGNPVHKTGHVTLEVLNGMERTHVFYDVPLAAIEPPIGWKPQYTIYCTPDKVAIVLSWFKRGIRVKVDHALDRLAGNAFMPLDTDANTQPSPYHYGYYSADEVLPDDCPNVFSVVAYVEQEFFMPKDAWDRKQYRKACARLGWKIWSKNYGCHGYAWFRSKEVPVYLAGKGHQTPIGMQEEYIYKALTPPSTALDILDSVSKEFPHDSDTERECIANGLPIPRWILYRAGLFLQGYQMEYRGIESETHAGNSTWMFDPLAKCDPVKRN